MSPESKSVKMVSLVCLIVGIIGLAISAYVFVATSYDITFKFLFLAMPLEIATYGFTGARAANVPSDIPEFAKQATWSPLFCIIVLGDCYMKIKFENPVLLGAAAVCTVLSVVLALVANKAGKAIKSA